MRLSQLLVISSLTILTAGSAFAQTMNDQMRREDPVPTMGVAPGYSPAIDSVGGGAIPSLPLDVMSNGTITYVNGGIGDEELAELKAKKHEFNLHLLLTGPTGEFISDASLRLADASGKPVLTLDGAGPYTYVRLPAGNYTLESSSVRDTNVKKMALKIPESGSVNKQINFAEPGGVTTQHQPTATID